MLRRVILQLYSIISCFQEQLNCRKFAVTVLVWHWLAKRLRYQRREYCNELNVLQFHSRIHGGTKTKKAHSYSKFLVIHINE